MRLTLQRYDIDVRYKPGKECPVAECLSRNPSGEPFDFDFAEASVAQIAISDHRLGEYREATREDSELQALGNL